MKFPNCRNILTVLTVFAALHVEAQTWSNATNSVTTYVTVASLQNYAVQTNQLVKVVGLGSVNANGQLLYVPIICSLPDGTSFSTASISSAQGMIFSGLTNISVGNMTWGQYGVAGSAATFEIKTPSCYNINTIPVIPQGRSALVQVQTTYNLNGGQWTTIYSQAFTNTTGTNQFFTFTLSAP